MDRRRYLSSVAVGLALGVAGCTSGGPEDTDESEDIDESEDTGDLEDDDAGSNETTEADETPSSEAADALESADEDLNEAIDLILEEIATAWVYYSADASISTGGIEVALENANTSIEEADEAATTDAQRERVGELEILTETVDKFLDVIVTVGDGINQISTALSYENNSRYEDAADSISDAKEIFDEANSQFDGLKSTFAELGDGTDTGVDYAEAEDAINEFDVLVSGYVLASEAGVPYDRGLADYETANDAYNNEDFGTAADIYESALDHLEKAESMYREGEEEVTQSLRDTFITQTCYTGKYVEITELMIEASVEAEAERYEEARSLVQETSAISFVECG